MNHMRGHTLLNPILRTVALAMTMAGLAATPAAAGEYSIYSCRTPQGAATGIVGDASGYGWQQRNSGESGLLTSNTCVSGGSLRGEVSLDWSHGNGSFARWEFTAPPSTSITAYDLDWSYYVHRNTFVGTQPSTGTAGGVGFDSDATEMFDQATQANSSAAGTQATPVNRKRSGFDAATLRATAVCTAPTCNAEFGATNARFDLYRSVVTLLDSMSPQVGTAGGEAVDQATWSGSKDVTFTATDQGGGVYRLLTRVDGATINQQVVNDNAGRCADADPTGGTAYQFIYPRPCSLSTSGSTTIDTTTLPEGSHSVRLVVEDAAGNETTLYGPVTKTIDNVPPPRNTVAPAISGTPQVGRTFVASPGAWDPYGLSGPTFEYQWRRCDAAGASCSDVAGATAPTYDLGATDAYRRMLVAVRATTTEGSTWAVSAPSGIVADTAGNTVAPSTNTTSGADGTNGTDGSSGISGPDGASGTGTTGANGTSATAAGAEGRGAPNGDNPSDQAFLTAYFAKTRKSRLTAGYGRRTVVGGKLTDRSGVGIRDARIELVSTNAVAGAKPLDKGGARTRQDGSWTLILPKNVSSRRLSFGYRSHANDPRPVSEALLTLRVRAGLSMRVAPKRTRNGGTIRFAGRLLGRPLPARGKVVELQARDKGAKKWITFKTMRAKGGRFSARYTFRRTSRRVTYEFRARAREDGGYPFATGVSRLVRVRVG